MKRAMAGLLEAPATTSGGGGGSDIRSAFRSAVASAVAGKDVNVRHRASAQDVEASDDADETETDEGDPDADDDDEDDEADEGTEDQDDDADEREDDSDDEDEDADENADDDADEDSDEGDADEDDEDADEQPGRGKSTKHALNDPTEFRKLQDKYKDDPKGLRKELLKTFTQKTQDIAVKEKQYRGLLSYLPLVEALERNPESAIRRLAKVYEVDLGDAAAGTAKAKGKGRAAAETDDEDSKEFIDGILKDFKSDLGPDLEYMADALGPAMTKALQKMADRTVSTRVKSLEDATVELARNAGNAESDRVMESFYRTHKDYADYEEEMDELARKLVGEGDNVRPIPMSEGEFLEFLYDTVKARRAAGGQKDTIKAEARRLMKKRLKKLATARSGDRRPASVPEERIRRRPRGKVSLRDAFKAARAGITFDDDEDDL